MCCLEVLASQRTLSTPFEIIGAPDRIRTCDLWLRRPTLYPAELRVQVTIFTTAGGQGNAPFPVAQTDCGFAKARQNTLANCLRGAYALHFHSFELSKFFFKLLISIENLAHPTGFEPVTSAFGAICL
jgi:hypothetical protein